VLWEAPLRFLVVECSKAGTDRGSKLPLKHNRLQTSWQNKKSHDLRHADRILPRYLSLRVQVPVSSSSRGCFEE
jgi:hypothetical protein